MARKRMIRSQGFQFICLVCIVALGLITIVGSGGGGGGGGGSTSASTTYTGSADQADVTSGNAQALASGALGAGLTGSALRGIGAVETAEDGHIAYFRTLKITQLLENALLQVDLSSESNGRFLGSTQSTGNITVEGACGGTATYNITYDNVSGNFSGSYTFNNYCNDGVIISGTTSFSGTLDLSDPDNPTLETFTFTFDNLTDGTFTMNGTISMDLTSVPITIDFDMLLQDNSTKKVYWANDYVLELTDYGSYVEIAISSGTYYDPDYGYVTFETTTPFVLYNGDDWPSSGVLVATGTGNTKAKLEALSASTCQITADTDGDGVYDYDSGVLNWDEL